ncbi:MAG: hypothetical protein AB7P04_02510 [Bacteriovoracia bacterium]
MLCKSIVTRLENQKSIAFPPRLRQIVQDEIAHLIGRDVLTDEDLHLQTLEKIGASQSALEESAYTENAQYRAARSIVRKTFGDDELNGFYFQKTLKAVAQTIAQYFMRSSHIDEVYETDEDLEQLIVGYVKKFNPANLH